MNQDKIVNAMQMRLVDGDTISKHQAKKIDIISLQLVKEYCVLYPEREINSPEDAFKLLNRFLIGIDREYFMVVCLDSKKQPSHINVCHIGSLNASIVHPREVLKPALLSNASSIIVAHNHPSGDPTPSREDIEVTKRLHKAGQLLGVELLDHLVVCESKFISLREKGFID